MKNRIFRMFRTYVAMMLVVAMLMSSAAYAGTMTLPSAVKSIAEEAFMGDTSVENVIIPDGATSIGARAFSGCTNLQTVQIPDSVTSIGEDAFDGCTGVTIVCSSASEAAKYAEANGINVQYTDAVEPEFELTYEQYIETMYVGGNGWMGNLIFFAEVNGYDAETDGEVEWELECLSGEDIIAVYPVVDAPDVIPENQYQLRLEDALAVGTAKFRLSVTIGDYTDSCEFAVELVKDPGDLPGGFEAYAQNYNVGDTMEFTIDDLYLTNADGSEYTGSVSLSDSNVHMELFYAEDYPIWQLGAEYIDGFRGGIRVTFTEDGRYLLPVTLHVGNYIFYKEIVVYVGSGMPSEAYINKDFKYDVMYVGAGDDNGWLGNAYLENWPLADGETVEWSVELTDSSSETPVIDVYIDEPWAEDVRGIDLWFGNMSGETGYATYTLTAAVVNGDETVATYSAEYKVTVEACPEELPTDENVSVPQTLYEIGTGETIEFRYDDIQLVGAPEGVEWSWSGEYHDIDWMWYGEGVSYTESEEGFSITFNEPGRYTLKAAAIISGNYVVAKAIVVNVGEVTMDNVWVGPCVHTENVFTDLDHDEWFCNVTLNEYQLAYGEQVEWSVESKTGEGLVELVIGEVWENSLCADIIVRNPSGNTGSETFTVTASVGGYTFTTELNVTVMDRPENLPGDDAVIVDIEKTVYEVGEEFKFDFSQISVDESMLPEGMTWCADIWETEAFDWYETGITTTFSEAGIYSFMAVVRLSADYSIGKRVYITVGDVEPEVIWTDHSTTMYSVDAERYEESDLWIADVQLTSYVAPEGVDVVWNAELISGDASVRVDVWPWGGENDYCAGFHAFQTGDVLGETTWLLTATAGEDVLASREITINLVARPEDMYLAMETDTADYYITAGDTFEFTVDDFRLSEDSVYPEDAAITKVIYADSPFTDNETSWEGINLTGFSTTLNDAGTYVFVVEIMVDNEIVSQDIAVHVDGGAYISQDIDCYYEFIGEGSVGELQEIGTLYLENINFKEDMVRQISWSAESKTGEGIIELSFDEGWDDGRGVGIYVSRLSETTGSETFTVYAEANGHVFSTEITFELRAMPENLPTDDDVYLIDCEENITLEVGEEFVFNYDQIGLNNLPEDMSWTPQIHNADWDEETAALEWNDDGIRVSFNSEGTYYFRAVARISANYWIGRRVTLVVGDGINDDMCLGSNVPFDTLYVYEGDDCNGEWLGDVWVEGYANAAGADIEWDVSIVEHDGDEPFMSVYVEPREDGNISFHCGGMTGATGYVDVQVRCIITVNGNSKELTEVYTFNAVEMPEDILTDDNVSIPQSVYDLEVGEEFVYTYDMVTVDGLAEGTYYEIEFHEMNMIEALDTFEWTENGFSVTFNENGRYVFRVMAKLANNYRIGQYVTVNVGTGEQNYTVEWETVGTTMYNGKGDLWVAEVAISDYVAPAGRTLEWSMEPAEGQDNVPLELYFESEYDDANYWYRMITATQLYDATGTYTFVVKAFVDDEVVLEETLTVDLVELPKDMALEIYVEQTEYYIEAGEEFFYSYDNFCFTEDSVYPEDAQLIKQVDTSGAVVDQESFTWTYDENGKRAFSVTFSEPGRYSFIVRMRVNNYALEQRISIIVGEDAYLDVYCPTYVIIADENYSDWVGNAYLNNYHMAEGEWIDWHVEQLTETDEPLAELYVDNTWDDGRGANLHVCNLTGGTGEMTYRVSAIVSGVCVASQELTFSFIEYPEDIPDNEDIYADSYYYEIENGTYFEFTRSMFGVNNVPEGMSYTAEYHDMEEIEVLEDFHWLEGDGGFGATFTKNGRYVFRAVAKFAANYMISREITIIVGDGVDPDFSTEWKVVGTTMYNGKGDLWVADAYINNYVEPADCDLEWIMTPVEGQENVPLELYFENESTEPNNWYRMITATQLFEATGTYRFSVKAVAGDEVVLDEIVTVNLIEMPDEINVAIRVDADEYRIEAGEEFVYYYNYFGFTEDSVYPEDAKIIREVDASGAVVDQESFSWFRDAELGTGFRVTFNDPGRYAFTVRMRVNNYPIEQRVTIIVGEGPTLTVYAPSDIFIAEAGYEGWAGNAYLNNHHLINGEWIAWDLELLTETESPVAEVYVDNTWDDTLGANLHIRNMTGETGELTYRISAIEDETYNWSEEFTFTVISASEDMPTDDDVYVDADNDGNADSIDYVIAPGETFEFHYDWIRLSDDCVLPEGVEWNPEIHDTNINLDEHIIWTDEGISVTLYDEGVYTFRTAARIANNYSAGPWATITVGDGIPDDMGINVNVPFDTVYIHDAEDFGGAGVWLGDFWLNSYNESIHADAEWSVEVSDNAAVTGVHWDVSESTDGISIFTDGLTGTEGEFTVTVTAEFNGTTFTEERTFRTASAEELSGFTDEHVTVPETVYYVDPGVEFSFDLNWIGLNDSEGMYWESEVHDMEAIEAIEGFWWDGSCFRVTFPEDGIYTFRAMVKLGANYHVGREITIVVGSATYVEWNEHSGRMYMGYGDMWVIDAGIMNYSGEDEIQWNLERIDGQEDPCIELFFADIWENNIWAGVHARQLTDQSGYVTYRLTATAGDETLLERDITVTLEDIPEDYRLEMWLESDLYMIGAGEEFTFTADNFGLDADNSVLYGDPCDHEFWNTESLTEIEGFEWIDGGFRVTIPEEGVYTFTAVISAANVFATRDVTVVVGGADFIVTSEQVSEIYADGDNCWILYADLRNCDFAEGDVVEWTVDPNGDDMPVVLYADNYVGDYNEGVNIHTSDLNGSMGYAEFTLTAKIGDSSVSKIIGVNVVDRPEDLPTGISVENDIIEMAAGETLHVDVGSEFTDGNVPSGAWISDDIWIDEGCFGGAEVVWNEDYTAFDVTIEQDGRYVFTVAKWLNNIAYTHDVIVYVGTGEPEGVEIRIDQRFASGMAYPDNGVEHYVAGAYIEGYTLGTDEYISWETELVEFTGAEQLPAELYVADTYNNGMDAAIHVRNMTGETGTIIYRVRATTNRGYVIEKDITYELISEPEGLPSGITVFETDVQLNAGDTYTFETGSVSFTDGEIPEGIEAYVEFFDGMDYLGYMPNFCWNDDGGFSVTFPRDGYFEFVVAYRIGTNYCLTETVCITVGEGMPSEISLTLNDMKEVLYTNAEIGSSVMMCEIYMNGYEPYEGENMLWEVERISGSETIADLCFSEIRDNNCTAQLTAYLTAQEAGEATFRIHITTESGYRSYVDYTVRVVEP